MPVQFAGRTREAILPQVVELLGLQVEYRSLIVHLRGGEIKRPAQPGVEREAARGLPIVLHVVLHERAVGSVSAAYRSRKSGPVPGGSSPGKSPSPMCRVDL